jgi:hypothetical protein
VKHVELLQKLHTPNNGDPFWGYEMIMEDIIDKSLSGLRETEYREFMLGNIYAIKEQLEKLGFNCEFKKEFKWFLQSPGRTLIIRW